MFDKKFNRLNFNAAIYDGQSKAKYRFGPPDGLGREAFVIRISERVSQLASWQSRSIKCGQIREVEMVSRLDLAW